VPGSATCSCATYSAPASPLHPSTSAPFDSDVDPVKQVRGIVKELEKCDPELAAKPRWIVLNKLDMIPAEERAERVAAFKKRLRWKGPVFSISALTREGCEPLVRAIYDHVKTYAVAAQAERDPRFDEGTSVAGDKATTAASRAEADTGR
jgi:GTP-binding protein